MNKYLYGASVQGIQGYIFKTNELKSIIGASEMIKSINNKICEKFEKNIIINAAGNIKLLFKENEIDILKDHVENFIKNTQQNAYGITISQAVVEFKEGGLKEAFDTLEKKLHIQRNKKSIPLDNSICILNIAPKSGKPEVNNKLDKATIQKNEMNKNGGVIPKNKKNKTAIIHADGNALGAKIRNLLKDLKSDDEVLNVFKSFSKNLDIATKKAFNDAKNEFKNKYNIRDVILGGDDMSVICNADCALEFTDKFLHNFEKQTENLLGKKFSASAGIAYCNHKYPFHYAVDLAEQLCNYAKKYSKQINLHLPPSSIMFHNIQSSSFESYANYIKTSLTFKNDKEEIRMDYGPYFLNKIEGFSTICDFLSLVENFKIKNSPLSRYRQWLSILAKDSNQADERLKRIAYILELKEKFFDIKKFKENLKNFNPSLNLTNLLFKREFLEDESLKTKKTTPIFDIVEYLSVIEYEKIQIGVDDEN